MKYKENEVIENIKLLYLITLLYYPRIQSSNIPRIICKALEIEDEESITNIKVNCILEEAKLIKEGLIRKGYFSDVPKYHLAYVILTPKGFSKIMLTQTHSEALNNILKSFVEYCKKKHAVYY